MDPRNKEVDLDSLMYSKLTPLTDEDMKKQEGDYIYRYRYNGGGASQVWLGSGRSVFNCITLSKRITFESLIYGLMSKKC